MAVNCPVTGRECPYLRKLDSVVCPKEHECDAVKASYVAIGKKPPASAKKILLFSLILLLVVVTAFFIVFFVIKGNPGFLDGNSPKPSHPVTTDSGTPTPTPSPSTSIEASKQPMENPTSTPINSQPVATITPVPLTSDKATMPVHISFMNNTYEIISVPLDENLKILVYPSAHLVSWYEGSFIPGNAGNCIIFGHKYFEGRTGAFYNLDSLVLGYKVSFTLDNGSNVEQMVYDIKTYEGGLLPNDVLELENTEARTVLISETGPLDPATGNYKDLLVVFLR